ncbi:MAG: carbohydrate-binding family 9-like protein [Melioribacteraceae bacterium]|nr:carbohydrate-binding family 9-like protein [Melioribacteraceae bacterium]
MKTYTIKLNHNILSPNIDWTGNIWKNTEHLEIDNYRPEGSDHHPKTSVKLCYNYNGIFSIYKVEDKYIRAVHNDFQGDVYKDSCVEFFVKPKDDKGYFNFEFNCIGNIIAGHKKGIVDGKKETCRFTKNEIDLIKVKTSLSGIIENEIKEPLTWYLSFFIPFSLFEKHIGNLKKISESSWKANFYKCGDKTSHPHWVSWSPVSELNFHLPECFGKIIFE